MSSSSRRRRHACWSARRRRRPVPGREVDPRLPDGVRLADERVDSIGIVSEGAVNAGEAWMHGPVVLSWDAIERESARTRSGPQRRAPRVLPSPRHARRLRRRHAGARQSHGDPGVDEGDVRRVRGARPGRPNEASTRSSTPTVRRIRPSSSPSRPSASSNAPARSGSDRPALYALLGDHYRQDPAERFET